MNIAIVGGGTIGWMSALYLNKKYPQYNIILIESSQIGIIGVGESTTTPFIPFLKEIDIDVFDLMKETGATFKTGTKFTNWSNDSSYYFSVMTPWHPNLLPSSYSNSNINETFFCKLVAENKPITSIGAPKLVEQYKSPFFVMNGEKIAYTYHSVHIDGVKTTNYLRKKSKNIQVIDNVVSHFENNSHDEINKIVFKDTTTIDVDFVFDCTGFAKLGLKKHYDVEWESYKKWLSVDSTITCMIPNTGDIPSYTECIAMKYGWMFKVPMKDRYGTGYNFDSNYISANEAHAEMEEYYKQELKILKHVTYDAGHYKKTWVKNCVGLGLSSGFIEPMAGSNIAIANEIVKLIDLDRYFKNDVSVIDKVNSIFNNINETFLCNIYFRYLTRRDDTEFWNSFRNKEMPNRLKIAIEQFKNSGDLIEFSNSLEQSPIIWLAAIQGLGHRDYLDLISKIKVDSAEYHVVEHRLKEMDALLNDTAISHRDFLNLHL